ncbi:sigma 54-interacting transcriptional regulator [Dyadobacter psychrotolerans]|uniref:Response regulator n=1 Tax=Dyadobacter psychrotolerans TaxID=2541721 RepID=A0A4R5DCR6_9BACT|nr:sigma 54-interacting transcriptional regulator [Dyadobacter psychrotolerans]TDE10797.1 response regulator [Dyadobacter psychrotolerans]
MNNKVLIVEDQFIEANNLQMILERAGYSVCTIALSVPQALKIVEEESPGLVLLDIFLQGNLTGIDLAKILKEKNIAFIYLSANSNKNILEAAKQTKPYGFLVKPFREKDVLVTLNISNYLHEQNLDAIQRREAGLLEQLKGSVAESSGFEQKVIALAKAFQAYVPFDFITTLPFDPTGKPEKIHGFHRIGLNQYKMLSQEDLLQLTGISRQDILYLQKAAYKETRTSFYNQNTFKQVHNSGSFKRILADIYDTESCLSMSIHLTDGTLYQFFLFSQNPNAYYTDHVAMFNRWKVLITDAFENNTPKTAKGNVLIASAGNNSNSAQQDELFEGIIGRNHGLLAVLDHITVVSPSDTSVFIVGESGTGKESIADAIHRLSPRKNKPFIKVNCAALPASLIESELFGHEKGAFTGATEKRIGKFEQAEGGTIFLDEIGEMHFDAQVKLLRVLQEKEIERVGGTMPIKINVRVIAATNREMEVEVSKGRFRLDLYYRLNVFPIVIPPLRQRKDDIAELAKHFTDEFASQYRKKISGVSDKVMQEMLSYQWPGNIRELRNQIERGVLLAQGTVINELNLPKGSGMEQADNTTKPRLKSMEENERDHIMEVLKSCNGKIFGKGGAAEVLGLNTSTLNSRIKKLGIDKEKIF